MYKSCVTHYFSIKKAERDLGYQPTIVNDIAATLEHYIKQGRKREKKKQSTFMYYVVNTIIAVIFASFLLSCLPGASWGWPTLWPSYALMWNSVLYAWTMYNKHIADTAILVLKNDETVGLFSLNILMNQIGSMSQFVSINIYLV